MSSESEDFSDIRPPISDSDLARLQSLLHRMAARYARCEADRLDLVAEANLRLLQKDNWTNPTVAAESAMKDYFKSRGSGLEGGNGMRKGPDELVRSFGDEEGELNPTGDAGEPIDILIGREGESFVEDLIAGLDVSDECKQMAVRFWGDGESQASIAKEFGVWPTTVSRRLASVQQAIREWYASREED